MAGSRRATALVTCHKPPPYLSPYFSSQPSAVTCDMFSSLFRREGRKEKIFLLKKEEENISGGVMAGSRLATALVTCHTPLT